jgi:hypothetical protein
MRPGRATDISMVLPGSWANIPVGDELNADRIIAALVSRQVGRSDRLARVRRESKEQLKDVVARARVAGVFQVALSLEILPGIPFPAAMFLDFRPWAGQVPEPADRASRLLEMLPTAEILDLDSGITARAWRQVTIKPGEETIPDTKLEYLLPTPSGDQLLHIIADAPVECDPEMIVALFDAMVDSIRWREPIGPDDGIH